MKLILLSLLPFFFFSCTSEKAAEQEIKEATTPEVAPEWEILNLSAWRNFKADTISPIWKEENGAITLTGKGGGDIITKKQYENFELELEWKISEGGNSGIFFRVVEADTLGAVYHSGPEMQVLDNDKHPDAKIVSHRAGDNYDLEASSEETVKPVGEWNAVKLIVNNGKVEHWLNGTKVIDYEIGSTDWKERLSKSKFTKWPMYGISPKGHLALQDHGDQVWFRNIRVRTL